MYKKNKLGFTIPGKICESSSFIIWKIWSKELVAVLIGVLMAFGFLSSNLFGRNGGFGITGPLFPGMTIFSILEKLAGPLSCCRNSPKSFITTILGGEFSIVIPKLKPILNVYFRGLYYGCWRNMGIGCFVGNVMSRYITVFH